MKKPYHFTWATALNQEIKERNKDWCKKDKMKLMKPPKENWEKEFDDKLFDLFKWIPQEDGSISINYSAFKSFIRLQIQKAKEEEKDKWIVELYAERGRTLKEIIEMIEKWATKTGSIHNHGACVNYGALREFLTNLKNNQI